MPQPSDIGSLASAEWFKFRSASKRRKHVNGDDASSMEQRVEHLEAAVKELQVAVQRLSAQPDNSGQAIGGLTQEMMRMLEE